MPQKSLINTRAKGEIAMLVHLTLELTAPVKSILDLLERDLYASCKMCTLGFGLEKSLVGMLFPTQSLSRNFYMLNTKFRTFVFNQQQGCIRQMAPYTSLFSENPYLLTEASQL